MSGIAIDFRDNSAAIEKQVKSLNNSISNVVSTAGRFSFGKGQQQANGISESLKNLTVNFKSAGRAGTDSMSNIQRGAERVNQSTNTLRNTVLSLGAAFIGLRGASAFNATSDSLTLVQNKLKLVIADTDMLTVKQRQLFVASRDARGSLDEMATTYQKFSMALSSKGVSDARITNIARTVQKSAAMSGSALESRNAAMMQFNQGIASGQLRGEELNSVLEQLDYLGTGLARSLGMTTGQLREFAAQGGVTTELLVAALEKMSTQVEKDFGRSTATAAESIAQLRSTVAYAMGEINQSLGVSTSFAKRVLLISSGLQNVGTEFMANMFIIKRTIANYINDIDLLSASVLAVRAVTRLEVSPLDVFDSYVFYRDLKKYFAKVENFLGTKKDLSVGVKASVEPEVDLTFMEKLASAAKVGFDVVGTILNTIRITVNNFTGMLPRSTMTLIGAVDSMSISLTSSFSKLESATVYYLLPTKRALEGYVELLSGFVDSDTRLERSFVSMLKSDSISQFFERMKDWSNAREGNELDNVELLLAETQAFAEKMLIPFKRIAIEMNWIDRNVFTVDSAATVRFVSYFRRIGDVLTLVYTDILEPALKSAFTQVSSVVSVYGAALIDAIGDNFEEGDGKRIGAGIVKGLVAIGSYLKNAVKGIAAGIRDGGGVSDAFEEAFSSTPIDLLRASVVKLYKFIKAIFTEMAKEFGKLDLTEGLVAAYGSAVVAVKSGMKTTFKAVSTALKSLKDDAILPLMRDMVDMYFDAIESAPLKNAASKIGAAFTDVAKGLPKVMSQSYSSIANGFSSVFGREIPMGLRSIARELDSVDVEGLGKRTANTLVKFVKRAASAIGDMVSNATDGDSFASDLVQSISRVADALGRAFKGVAVGFYKEMERLDVGASLVKSLAAGLLAIYEMLAALGKSVYQVASSTIKFVVDTSSLNESQSYMSKMFNSIEGYAERGLSGAFRHVSKFTESVKASFFDAYDAVVGHSYWPDLVDEVVAYTDNLFKAEPKVNTFLDNVKSVFDDIFQAFKTTKIYEATTNIRIRVGSIDWGRLREELGTSLATAITAAFMLAFGGIKTQLLSMHFFLGLFEASSSQMVEGITPLIAEMAGKVLADFTNTMLEGLWGTLESIVATIPKFVTAFLEGFSPVTFALSGLSEIAGTFMLVFGVIKGFSPLIMTLFGVLTFFNNSLTYTLITAGLLYGLFKKKGWSEIGEFLMGKPAGDKKERKYGVMDVVDSTFNTGFNSARPKKTADQKMASTFAMTGAALIATSAFESISLMQAAFFGVPFLTYAFLGKDGGGRLARQIVFYTTKTVNLVLDTMRNFLVDRAGPGSMMELLFTGGKKPPSKGPSAFAMGADLLKANIAASVGNLRGNADEYGKKNSTMGFFDAMFTTPGAGKYFNPGSNPRDGSKESLTSAFDLFMGGIPIGNSTARIYFYKLYDVIADNYAGLKRRIKSSVMLDNIVLFSESALQSVQNLAKRVWGDAATGIAVFARKKILLASIGLALFTASAFSASVSSVSVAGDIAAGVGTLTASALGLAALVGALALLGGFVRKFRAYKEELAKVVNPEAFKQYDKDVASAKSAGDAMRKAGRSKATDEMLQAISTPLDDDLLYNLRKTHMAPSGASYATRVLYEERYMSAVESAKLARDQAARKARDQAVRDTDASADFLEQTEKSKAGEKRDKSNQKFKSQVNGEAASRAFKSISDAALEAAKKVRAAFSAMATSLSQFVKADMWAAIGLMFTSLSKNLKALYREIAAGNGKAAITQFGETLLDIFGSSINAIGRTAKSAGNFSKNVGAAMKGLGESLEAPFKMMRAAAIKGFKFVGALLLKPLAIAGTVGVLSLWLFGPQATFVENLEWAFDKVTALFGLSPMTKTGKRGEIAAMLKDVNLDGESATFTKTLSKIDFGKINSLDLKVLKEVAAAADQTYMQLATEQAKKGYLSEEGKATFRNTTKEVNDVLLRQPMKPSGDLMSEVDEIVGSLTKVDNSFRMVLKRMLGWKPLGEQVIKEVTFFSQTVDFFRKMAFYAIDNFTSTFALMTGAIIGGLALFKGATLVRVAALALTGNIVGALLVGVTMGLGTAAKEFFATKFIDDMVNAFSAALTTMTVLLFSGKVRFGIAIAAALVAGIAGYNFDEVKSAIERVMDSFSFWFKQKFFETGEKLAAKYGQISDRTREVASNAQYMKPEEVTAFKDAGNRMLLAQERLDFFKNSGLYSEQAKSRPEVYNKGLKAAEKEFESALESMNAINDALYDYSRLAKGNASYMKGFDVQAEKLKTAFDFDLKANPFLDNAGAKIADQLIEEYSKLTIKNLLPQSADQRRQGELEKLAFRSKAKSQLEGLSDSAILEKQVKKIEAVPGLDGLSDALYRLKASSSVTFNTLYQAAADLDTQNQILAKATDGKAIEDAQEKIRQLFKIIADNTPKLSTAKEFSSKLQAVGVNTEVTDLSMYSAAPEKLAKTNWWLTKVQKARAELDAMMAKGLPMNTEEAKRKLAELMNGLGELKAAAAQMAAGNAERIAGIAQTDVNQAARDAVSSGMDIDPSLNTKGKLSSFFKMDARRKALQAGLSNSKDFAKDNAEIARLDDAISKLSEKGEPITFDSMLGSLEIDRTAFMQMGSAQAALIKNGTEIASLNERIGKLSAANSSKAIPMIKRELELRKANAKILADNTLKSETMTKAAMDSLGATGNPMDFVDLIRKQSANSQLQPKTPQEMWNKWKEAEALKREATSRNPLDVAGGFGKINDVFGTSFDGSDMSVFGGMMSGLAKVAKSFGTMLEQAQADAFDNVGKYTALFKQMDILKRLGTVVNTVKEAMKEMKSAESSGPSSLAGKLGVDENIVRALGRQRAIQLQKQKTAMSAIEELQYLPEVDASTELQRILGSDMDPASMLKSFTEQYTSEFSKQLPAMSAENPLMAELVTIARDQLTALQKISPDFGPPQPTVATNVRPFKGGKTKADSEREFNVSLAQDSGLSESLRASAMSRAIGLNIEEARIREMSSEQLLAFNAMMLEHNSLIVAQSVALRNGSTDLSAITIALANSSEKLKIFDASISIVRDRLKEASTSFADGFGSNLSSALSDVLKGKADENKSVLGTFFDKIINNFTSSVIDNFVSGLMSPLTGKDGALGKMMSQLGGDIFSKGSEWVSTGLEFIGLAEGGAVNGPGTGTSDSIPAMLSNGEFVTNAKATKRYLPLLKAINSGSLPKFAEGGLVSSSLISDGAEFTGVVQPSNVNNTTSSQQININITGDISRQTRSQVFEMLPTIAAGVNAHNREKAYKG